ncbi:flocculation protein FLO11-like [Gigantopelta aegis]|uniref:flocculation protein FLO11-like n=1 Tax=Gigantopelta aegis TaxID=1735272 RepID=UPI001B888940|nr:flocculation protein FLO11-like [Gigantopelta aegis]
MTPTPATTTVDSTVTMTPTPATTTVDSTVTMTPTPATTTVDSTVTMTPTPATTTVDSTVTMTPTPVTTNVDSIVTMTPTPVIAVFPDMTSSVNQTHNTHDIFCTSLSRANLSQAELTDILQRIVNKLRLDTKKLSATIRKKTSAPDHRRSSTSIGYMAGIFMSLPFLLLVIADVPAIVRDIRNIFQ